MAKALYDVIREAASSGALPGDFHLPAEQNGGIAFADGALDGIALYHRAPGHTLTAEQQALIARAIDQITAGSFYEAEESIWAIGRDIGALDAFEDLRQYIVAHIDESNAGNLFDFALTMAVKSPDRGVVKIALSMLSVFVPGEDVKAYIRTLGLSDEFTLYAAMAMGAWENPNEEWFQLATKVRGWGRIHLMDWIQPETDAIRRWILREGVHNTVMPTYSALDCWMKADVPAVLAGEVSPEDFRGIRDIISGLLDEGPVSGISSIENAEAHMLAFLKQAKGRALDDDDRAVIADIRDHFSESAGIAEACRALL